jgi:hypothetical protein
MQSTRANDRGSEETHPVGLAPEGMEGLWFNSDPATGEISKIVIAVRNQEIFLRAFGANRPEPMDWGEALAKPYVDRIGSTIITGLAADYDFGFMKTRLAGNIKYGTLVIQSYNEFCDASGRPAYFMREFFSKEVKHRPAPLPTAPPSAAQSDLLPAGRSARDVDMSKLTGHWTNTNPETVGITHFDLTARDGRYTLRASGAGRAEPWPEVEAFPHGYNVSGGPAVAFRAEVSLDFTEITLAANENKGLIVVASFHRFKDGSPRASYLKREFFYRTEAVQR